MTDEYGISLRLLTGTFKSQMQSIAEESKSWGIKVKQNTTVRPLIQTEAVTIKLAELKRELKDARNEMAHISDPQQFRIAALEVKDLENEIKGLEGALKEANKEKDNSGNQDFWNKMTKNAKRFTLSLFGIHSVWRLISSASHSYMAQDEQLQARTKILANTVGNILAPAIKKVVDIAEYGVIILAKLVQMYTGFNALENVNNKTLDKTTKKATAAAKALAGFDTLTTLSSSSSGAGGLGSLDAMGEFQKKVKEVDEIFKKYAPTIKMISDMLLLAFGAGMVAKIATFIGSASAGTGIAGLGGILGSIATMGAIAVIINCVVNGYQQVKETQAFLEKMSSEEQQKKNKEIHEQLSEIADITDTQRVNAKASLDLWKDSQNPLYKILGLSDGILRNVEGQVKVAGNTATKYKEILATQKLNKTEAQQIYSAAVDQLTTNKLLEDTYKKQGKDTTEIKDISNKYLEVVNELGKQYEIVDGKVIGVKNKTKELNDMKLKDKDLKVNMKGDTKDLETKSNNWFKTFSSGIAKWINTNMSSSAISNLFNLGKKLAGSVLKFDVGTNYVPQDTLAMVHKGEMIVPKKYNPSTSGIGGTNEETNMLLRQLNTTLENKQFNGYISASDITNTAINGINQQSRIMGRSVIK